MLMKFLTDNSAIVSSRQITLGKFDAVILIGDEQSSSFASESRVDSLCIIIVITCMFAFN